MSLLIVYPEHDLSDWLSAFARLDPSLKVQVWPEVSAAETVDFALCWNQPPQILEQFPNLKCISSTGAGVNHLLNDPTLPAAIPLVRVIDRSLQQSMADYILLGVLEQARQFSRYRQQQQDRRWQPLSQPPRAQVSIGIMGYGALGKFVGQQLRGLGYQVQGWSRSRKSKTEKDTYVGQAELKEFLRQSNILVCLLPLTPDTENILGAEIFDQLPAGAYLINAARGGHLVEADLLSALDSGQLSGALLDVFRQEPLPQQHPFWEQSKITITPHVASLTNPHTAAKQILENYHRALAGAPLLNQVCRQRGY